MSLAPPPKESLGEVSIDSYHFDKYFQQKSNGSNGLRTERVAQPRALRKGDILSNGDRVLATPREGYNGTVWVLLSGGYHGHWIGIAARLPIALLTETDRVPEGFVEEMQE